VSRSEFSRDAPRGSLIVLLGSLTAFGPLSIDMYLPGMLAISHDLGAGESAVKLTLASFFAGITVAQLAVGPIADHWGRRRTLLAGLAVYVLASAGCALATSIEALIALRFLQALGGAAGLVVPRAVVRDLWSGRDAARVLSMLILVMGAAPVLAPMLGAVVVDTVGWRAVFGLLAAFGAIALACAARALPETAPPVISGSVVTRYLGLARHRSFVGYALAAGLAQSGMFAYIAGSPFVLMKLHGLSEQQYSLVFGLNAAGYIAAAQLNRRFLVARTPRQMLDAVLPVTVVAGLGVVAIAAANAGLILLLAGIFVFVASLGLIGPNATALALEDHAARAGLASALMGTLQFGAAALAALASSLGSGSAIPMALTMAGAALLGYAALRVIAPAMVVESRRPS
jgi:MFS transporter, DHA1 family, multidrug resistance protein